MAIESHEDDEHAGPSSPARSGDDEEEEEGEGEGDEAAGGGSCDEDDVVVGGTIDTPAYALLDGKFNDERVTFPITKLPVLLGRVTGDAPDPSLLAVARIKTLSRRHIRIEYRASAGTFSTDDKGKFAYKAERMKNPPENSGGGGGGGPAKGFYLLTCLGKNPVTVNGKAIKQSEQAVLHSGSTIRVHDLRLYFLLPTQESTATIQIPVAAAAKRKPADLTSGGPMIVHSSPVNTKRPKLAKSAAAAIAADAAAEASAPAATTTSSSGWPTLQSEIDSLKTSELLRQITDAIESDTWERRHQLIGSTVSYRAVMEAAKDPGLVQIAEAHGSVGRGDIMRWIAESPKFGNWVKQMHTKLEDKSYQASITKALIRAGYERTANTGRYIKWQLPADKDQGIPADDVDNDGGDDDAADDEGAKPPGPPPLSTESMSPEAAEGGKNGGEAKSGESSASSDDDDAAEGEERWSL
jgi:FHA domain